MKGRKPKPTALKVIEGNPGQRPLNQNEPKPKPIAPKAPLWLDEVAREEWERLAPILERLGLLTEADEIVFANLCQEYSDILKYRKVIADEGATCEHTNTKGEKNVITRPEAILLYKAQQMLKAYCVEFGLTPSSRGRISLPGMEDAEDEMEMLLRKKR